MARRKFVLSGRVFRSGVEVKRYVRDLIARTVQWHSIRGEDGDIMRALIALYPWADEKTGAGILDIYFGRSSFGGVSLYIRRIDGSETDISWMKCIDGHDERKSILGAFRAAIAPQVLDFRSDERRRGAVCAITGEALGEDAEVDHVVSFADLVAAYLAERGETLESVEVVDARGGIGSVLADPRAWRLYHAERANLRMLSKSAHAARSREQKAKR